MSEFAPPAVSGRSDAGGTHSLNGAALDALLADFRSWLEQGIPPTTETLDFPALLNQFVALKHEVNLQTKAVRAQQEQNAKTLQSLTQALELAMQAPRAREGDSESALRPILKTLIDLYDSLMLASREVERLQETLEPLLDLVEADPPKPPFEVPKFEAPPLPMPFVSSWARLLGAQAPDPKVLDDWKQQTIAAMNAALKVQQDEFLEKQRVYHEDLIESVARLDKLYQSLVTGYRMSVQRIERALQQQDMQPIDTADSPFDPELMEAVDTVADSGRPHGEVVSEVRRGYLWRGRVFRCAQVKVARG